MKVNSIFLICLYGLFWLIILSPYTIFLMLGFFSQQPVPTFVEIVGVLSGSYLYYEKVWIPVRLKFNTYDQEFCYIMNWRK